MSGLKLQRLGQIMEPEPGNPMEVKGVLNPAAVRGPDVNSGGTKIGLIPTSICRIANFEIGIIYLKKRRRSGPSTDRTEAPLLCS